jgi:hypothetical protein
VIETFVLILFSAVASGYSTAAVPGYQTRALCETAGKEYLEGDAWPRQYKFKCVKGPERHS